MKKVLLSLALASVSSVCFAQGEVAPIVIPESVLAGFKATCENQATNAQALFVGNSADAGMQFSKELEACLVSAKQGYLTQLLEKASSEAVCTDASCAPVITAEMQEDAAKKTAQNQNQVAAYAGDQQRALLQNVMDEMPESDKEQMEQLRQDGNDDAANEVVQGALKGYVALQIAGASAQVAKNPESQEAQNALQNAVNAQIVADSMGVKVTEKDVEQAVSNTPDADKKVAFNLQERTQDVVADLKGKGVSTNEIIKAVSAKTWADSSAELWKNLDQTKAERQTYLDTLAKENVEQFNKIQAENDRKFARAWAGAKNLGDATLGKLTQAKDAVSYGFFRTLGAAGYGLNRGLYGLGEFAAWAADGVLGGFADEDSSEHGSSK